MQSFEYAVTKHEAERFRQLVYFCSESAECSLDEVPGDQIRMLAEILNEKGQQGWELCRCPSAKGGLWPSGNAPCHIKGASRPLPYPPQGILA